MAPQPEIQKGVQAQGKIPKHSVRLKHRLKELHDKVNRRLTVENKALEKELSQVLTPEQLQVVEDFKPCLIPPRDLKNPVRAGQASSNEHAVKRLRRLRAAPENQWLARRDKIVQRMVDFVSSSSFG